MPVLLNAKHERFAQELAKGTTAGEAYELAGLERKPIRGALRSYVYLLIDPRDDTVFYVGKGKGRRAEAHWRAMLRGLIGNAPKHGRLVAIHRSGLRVEEVCFLDGLSDAAAYRLEQGLIRAVGFSSLVNILPGSTTPQSRSLAQVEDMMSRIKPFPQWYRERLPTDADCVMYAKVLKGLQVNAALLRQAVAI